MAGAAEAAALAVHGLGLVLAAAGLGWAAWAAWCLVRAPAPLAHAGPARVLVDHGPFAFGRHPMYLGGAVALMGFGLVLAAPALLAGALGFVALADRLVVPAEEAQLRQHYGGWYSDYADEVPRWF